MCFFSGNEPKIMPLQHNKHKLVLVRNHINCLSPVKTGGPPTTGTSIGSHWGIWNPVP